MKHDAKQLNKKTIIDIIAIDFHGESFGTFVFIR